MGLCGGFKANGTKLFKDGNVVGLSKLLSVLSDGSLFDGLSTDGEALLVNPDEEVADGDGNFDASCDSELSG